MVFDKNLDYLWNLYRSLSGEILKTLWVSNFISEYLGTTLFLRNTLVLQNFPFRLIQQY